MLSSPPFRCPGPCTPNRPCDEETFDSHVTEELLFEPNKPLVKFNSINSTGNRLLTSLPGPDGNFAIIHYLFMNFFFLQLGEKKCLITWCKIVVAPYKSKNPGNSAVSKLTSFNYTSHRMKYCNILIKFLTYSCRLAWFSNLVAEDPVPEQKTGTFFLVLSNPTSEV